MDPLAPYIKLIRAALVLMVLVALFFGGRYLVGKSLDFIQAPVQAELNAARGNLAASKAANDAQSKGVEGLQVEGKARQAASKAAVSKAGEENFNRAQGIKAAPAVGQNDYERMVNRIDRELRLQ